MRPLRRALALSALCAAALWGATAKAEGWRPNDDDALLLDARLGQYRLAEGVRGYRTPEGACLILTDIVAALDVPVTVDAKGVAEGWAFEEKNRLRIDRRADTVLHAGIETPLAPEAISDAPEGWCVSTASLSAWLGIQLKPDFANALLLLSSDHKLPIELAAERKARAARVRPAERPDLARLPQASLPYAAWRTPSLDAVLTVGGLDDKKRGDRFDRHYELYASGEALLMSVDARLSSNDRGEPSDFRVRAYRSDAAGELLGPLHATHFAVGDVSSFGSPLAALSMAGRGAVVTNRPIGLQETFDRKTFRGELPNGWDAELYRNGQLLAIAQNRADGRYEFADVPLLYGQNRFDIVLYGPQGQVRREHETVVVGAESIPPQESWYWAGISEDERDLLAVAKNVAAEGRGWRGTIGVERGLDERSSVSAQAHSLVIDGERRSYLEGAVRRSIGPALVEVAGSYEAGGGLAGRAQLLAQFGEAFVSAESIVGHHYVSDRVDKGVTGRHLVALDYNLGLGKSILPVHVEGRYTSRDNGNSLLEAGARVSKTISRISITGTVDWRRQQTATGQRPPDTIDAGLLANALVGRTRLRGELRWRLSPESRFESATLVAQRQIGERTDVRAEIGYERGLDRARGALGYVRRYDSFALSLSGELASDGSVAAGLNLAFSFGPDPRGGRPVRVTSAKLAASGSALVRVYHDDNGDGIREPNEAYAEDVQVMVGRTPVASLTDKQGEALVDGLEPHRPVLIGIDASSLADPLTRPTGPGVVVTPRPGLAVPIELPLVSAGEVTGTLIAEGGRTLEGIDLELVDGKGLVLATTRSDFDGFFLFESVPYGSYTLRIARLSAQAAGLSPALSRGAAVGGKTPSVRLGRVIAAYGVGATLAGRR